MWSTLLLFLYQRSVGIIRVDCPHIVAISREIDQREEHRKDDAANNSYWCKPSIGIWLGDRVREPRCIHHASQVENFFHY